MARVIADTPVYGKKKSILSASPHCTYDFEFFAHPKAADLSFSSYMS
jgi:hypothetical protein